MWNDGRARKEEPGVLVACISLMWIKESGGAVPSLMDLVRGELSLALSSVSRLLGISKHNVQSRNSKNSEFIPKREKLAVVIHDQSQELSPGLERSFGPPGPHITATLKFRVNVLILSFSQEKSLQYLSAVL